jgi:glycosyltransferase involved in cell wall biosynthesis
MVPLMRSAANQPPMLFETPFLEAGMDASIRGAKAGAPGMCARPVRSVDAARRESRAIPAALAGLRIALVHDWLLGMRGGEKCLEVLCRAFPDASLYTLIHRRGALSDAIESMTIRTSPLQMIPSVDRHYRNLLPIMPLAARSWRPKHVDLVVSLSHCVAKAVVPPPGVPHVCYCFTPMRYAWEGRQSYLESWSDRPVRRALAKILLWQLRRWDRTSASRVTHFVAISQTVRERIAHSYGRDSTVIQPPADVAFYAPESVPRSREDFYLVVSALVPYKRIDQAVSACGRLKRRLIVIGEGPERSRLEATAGAAVHFLGWQSDEVIRDHYRRCRALLFPGEEDFGIVPIEAMACGTPVIALARGGVAETIDDQVGATYEPPSTDGLLHAIQSWEARGCPYDPTEARRRAEALSLPVFRQRILGYLADVVAPSAGHVVPPAPHLRRFVSP